MKIKLVILTSLILASVFFAQARRQIVCYAHICTVNGQGAICCLGMTSGVNCIPCGEWAPTG